MIAFLLLLIVLILLTMSGMMGTIFGYIVVGAVWFTLSVWTGIDPMLLALYAVGGFLTLLALIWMWEQSRTPPEPPLEEEFKERQKQYDEWQAQRQIELDKKKADYLNSLNDK